MPDSTDQSEEPGLGLDLPEMAAPGNAPAYRVLARKYRPQSFDELIGQDAMVQTLANAIARDRIAHAFLLTGVRGVGKTSTARLIAKALNCIGPDGQGGPTIQPCGVCEPCKAIAEGRHIDVIEMDAASHTGIDDVREIIDAVRYAAVSARYKIYIIDEVHMLSKAAFNALLKTLEEPPEHVKFLFATTEIDKVPVTVLSRCQRFDLRRIPAETLIGHFTKVAEAEGVTAEPEAVAMIARAAEGSVRDGLSILDQAIAHGAGQVSAEQVRDMLGLADRGRTRQLLQTILSGSAAEALTQLDEAHGLGIDPLALLRGLMTELHEATRVKASNTSDPTQPSEQQESARQLADRLSWPQIHRLWQLLLKALSDAGIAPDPEEAAVMGVLRLIHAADLPDPAELVRRVTGQVAGGQGASTAPASASTPAAARLPASFPEMIKCLEEGGKRHLAQQLHDHVGLASYTPGEVSLKPLRPLGADWSRDLTAALKSVTGTNWVVTLAEGVAEPSLLDQERIAEERVRAEVLADPTVKAALDAIPGAELESYSLTKGA